MFCLIKNLKEREREQTDLRMCESELQYRLQLSWSSSLLTELMTNMGFKEIGIVELKGRFDNAVNGAC